MCSRMRLTNILTLEKTVCNVNFEINLGQKNCTASRGAEVEQKIRKIALLKKATKEKGHSKRVAFFTDLIR